MTRKKVVNSPTVSPNSCRLPPFLRIQLRSIFYWLTIATASMQSYQKAPPWTFHWRLYLFSPYFSFFNNFYQLKGSDSKLWKSIHFTYSHFCPQLQQATSISSCPNMGHNLKGSKEYCDYLEIELKKDERFRLGVLKMQRVWDRYKTYVIVALWCKR